MPIINVNTGQPASNDFHDAAQKLKELFDNTLPNFVVQKAQDIVDKSFQAEQYQDKTSRKWKGRKKEEQPGKERSGRRALLVKTGKLIGTTTAERRGNDVVIGSDTPYSQIHNEGGTMGNGGEMPQRQFMPIPGERNKELDDQIDKFNEQQLDKIHG